MRRDLIGVLVTMAILIVLPILLFSGAFIWFTVAAPVEDVRALEDRAISYINGLRAPELEFRRGLERIPERDIRLSWAVDRLPGGQILHFFLWGDSGPPWSPGSGVTISALFRSSLHKRETCHLIAQQAGKRPSECVEGDVVEVGYPGEHTYTLDLEDEGVQGDVEVYLSRLRNERGVLMEEFFVVADFAIEACGEERLPGVAPCP